MTAFPSELEQAVRAAGRTLLTLYGLMAAHDIPDISYLQSMLTWPAGLRNAYNDWMAAMVAIVNELGRLEGIKGTAGLSERDKIKLTYQAYGLVLDSPTTEGIRKWTEVTP